MPRHTEKRVLPYQADQMYALVADVASYPEFLPWCAAARIRSRQKTGAVEVVEADLVISFKVFRERFGSRVVLLPEARRIETEYLDGPFKYLHSFWQIEPEGDGCRVLFEVDFEFRNAILQKAIGLFFDEAMRRVVGAFDRRAHQLYG